MFASTVNANTGIDPTKPLIANKEVYEVKQQSRLVLQSIILNNQQNNKKAIVSGKLMSVGDMLYGFKLREINKKSVVLASAEREITLTLFSEDVVKTQ